MRRSFTRWMSCFLRVYARKGVGFLRKDCRFCSIIAITKCDRQVHILADYIFFKFPSQNFSENIGQWLLRSAEVREVVNDSRSCHQLPRTFTRLKKKILGRLLFVATENEVEVQFSKRARS